MIVGLGLGAEFLVELGALGFPVASLRVERGPLGLEFGLLGLPLALGLLEGLSLRFQFDAVDFEIAEALAQRCFLSHQGFLPLGVLAFLFGLEYDPAVLLFL